MNPLGKGPVQFFNQNYDNQDKAWLQTVLKEVTTNSPDSIAIARGLLAKREISIKELDELHRLQQNTASNKRDESFSKKINELQHKILDALQEME